MKAGLAQTNLLFSLNQRLSQGSNFFFGTFEQVKR
jgi:hypothetical protein